MISKSESLIDIATYNVMSSSLICVCVFSGLFLLQLLVGSKELMSLFYQLVVCLVVKHNLSHYVDHLHQGLQLIGLLQLLYHYYCSSWSEGKRRTAQIDSLY